MRHKFRFRHVVPLLSLAIAALASAARADVKLPAIFTEHLVLQRDLADPVWGWAAPGEEVTVSIGDQKQTTTADASGHWRVKLAPMPAGGPHQLTVKGKNTITLSDVLVGEVWVCSGQSNMAWTLSNVRDGDLEIKSANFPKIRIVHVPNFGVGEPQEDFKGEWRVCSPSTAGSVSAVGYFFGKQLYQTLDVPIGLIDDAWGGSACEAWVRRDVFEKDERLKPLAEHWREIESKFDAAKTDAEYQAKLATWKTEAEMAKLEGKKAPNQPHHPGNPLTGNARPANIYNGVLKPTIGYGIRGAIWYQGETNAGRAYQYRELFPLMIKNWREDWGQGDFPFYWVQLADFKGEQAQPSESDWAELREAQTMTMDKLPKTGEAVIIDIGEGKDIHPRNKRDVGLRLARWALANDYGVSVPYQSPRYKSMEHKDNKIVLTIDHADGGLQTFDVAQPRGFTIAGDDKKFHPAEAKILDANHIEVWSNEVSQPVAVRDGWADNPIVNVYNKAELPLTPFRTDDWPGITAKNEK